jgi:HSP20 family protein
MTWNPFRDWRRAQREIEQEINRFWGAKDWEEDDEAFPQNNGRSVWDSFWSPVCDVKETRTDLTMQCDLPGISKNDLRVELNDGYLSVSGTRKAEEKKEGESFRAVERVYGNFARTIPVPEGVSPEHIKVRARVYNILCTSFTHTHHTYGQTGFSPLL